MGAVSSVVTVLSMLSSPAAPVTNAIIGKVVSTFQQPKSDVKLTTVEATGRGSTYELALANAKTNALGTVTGVFVVSSTKTVDDNQTTNTAEYAGGVIKSHDVVSFDHTDDIYTVIITAVVQTGKNNVVTGRTVDPVWRANVKALLDDQKQQQAFTPSFADQPKYNTEIKNVQAVARANFAEVKITYSVTWSPKFLDDVRRFVETGGRKINAGDPRTMYAVCFGTTTVWAPDETCTDVSTNIATIEKDVYLNVKVTYDNGKSKVHPVQLIREQNAMRVVTYAGSKMYHSSSGRQVSYGKGVVLFEKGSINSVIALRMPLQEAARISSIEAETVE